MENNIEKITRDQIATYLDTTPSSSATWKIIGIGVTSMGQEYNPQKTTEKWIIHKNATTTTDSYQISTAVSQSCYKGDPVFEFVNKIRREAGVGSKCVTNILDIDMWDATGEGVNKSYKATKYSGNIAITKYNDENAVIEYDLDYNGDPELGTVTFADGVPTFTPEV